MSSSHSGAGCGLVDEDQMLGIEVELVFKPGEPTAQDIGTILLLGPDS